VLFLFLGAILLAPVKLYVAAHIALNIREDWPNDLKVLGEPSWSEFLMPGRVPISFYWSVMLARHRQLPSFRSRLAPYYRACAFLSWVQALLVSLACLLLLWHFLLGPALVDISSRA